MGNEQTDDPSQHDAPVPSERTRHVFQTQGPAHWCTFVDPNVSGHGVCGLYEEASIHIRAEVPDEDDSTEDLTPLEFGIQALEGWSDSPLLTSEERDKYSAAVDAVILLTRDRVTPEQAHAAARAVTASIRSIDLRGLPAQVYPAVGSIRESGALEILAKWAEQED